jgi:glycerophosphoryl diester phosphodiesterase
MQVIAHRGASGHEPENTLRAIRRALTAGVDGIEIDLHQVEGKLVVIHDRWLQRTTSGKGQISDHKFEHLRGLDAGKGEIIPTLEEVFQLVAGKCFINIELKGVQDLSLLFEQLIYAQQHCAFNTQQLLISSYNHRLLQVINQQQPQYPIGALTACYPLDYALFAQRLHAYSVHLDVDFISKHFVNDAHSRGLKVFVYTVDEIADIDAMKALGVDGIFSNYPTESKSHIAHKK